MFIAVAYLKKVMTDPTQNNWFLKKRVTDSCLSVQVYVGQSLNSFTEHDKSYQNNFCRETKVKQIKSIIVLKL